jgi:N-acetylmuramoyl-L-alanine amidase
MRRGATVVMTRERDQDLGLAERQRMIEQADPTVSVSLHYNALPDGGDVMKSQGIGAFWYNPQSQDLARFMHGYLTSRLKRPSYGVFWDNLALTRPTAAPAVLLELGFLIHPEEYEWITDPAAQQALGEAIADGLIQWIRTRAAERR